MSRIIDIIIIFIGWNVEFISEIERRNQDIFSRCYSIISISDSFVINACFE